MSSRSSNEYLVIRCSGLTRNDLMSSPLHFGLNCAASQNFLNVLDRT